MSSPSRLFYEFGPFRLDAAERQLLRGEETVRLTPKEFETLFALVRGGGRVMSKEELLKEIWPDTFVEEATLAQNIFTLRKALAKWGEGQQYIETVPRRGYKFAARVRERLEDETTEPGRADDAGRNGYAATEATAEVAMEATPSSTSSSTSDGASSSASAPSGVNISSSANVAPPTARQSSRRPARAVILIVVLAVFAVVALVYAIFRFSVRPQTEGAARRLAFQSMKVTRLPVTGAVAEAAISPDGKYLAYVADEPGRQSRSISIRQVEAASNIQQIVPPVEGTFYGAITFSPDSQHVYFTAGRAGPDPPALFSVPVLGGTATKVVERFDTFNGSPAAFSPDGKRLAFVRGRLGEEFSLILADAATGDERTLVTRKGAAFFGAPAWSPDGRVIACFYGSAENLDSSSPFLGVTAFDAADGSETKVTEARWIGVGQMAWLPDASGLVLSAEEQELAPAQIWLLSYPSGEVRRVTNDLNTYLGASLTADGSALVAVQTDRVPNVWVAPAADSTRAVQITTGAGKFDGYYGLSWMPDGRIVYASVAGGGWDIWVMNADGSNQRQLTVNARSNYGPSVSADGRYVVFISNRAAGAFNVWRMDSDGANPKQLTSGRGENFAHVTADGRWVVYASVAYGQPSAVWKVPIDGGEPVRLTDKPASWPFVSPDGKSFVCTYGGGPGSAQRLAVIPIEGGQPTKLFDIAASSFRANTVWLPDGRGIAFLDSRTGTSNVWMQPLAGGRAVQLTDFKTDNVTAYDYSRDGRLAASRSVETTGVVLIRDFR
jgi:Tol biopolymer transport system component/DNA-binding winged helix-turn-helix (wHTH) protein